VAYPSKPEPQKGAHNLLKKADPKKVKAFLSGFGGDKPKAASADAMKRRLGQG
jgi:hypothetical protein